MDNDSDDGASVIEEASWPHIIIVPVSVLPNWEREFKTFCPDMNVVKYVIYLSAFLLVGLCWFSLVSLYHHDRRPKKIHSLFVSLFVYVCIYLD